MYPLTFPAVGSFLGSPHQVINRNLFHLTNYRGTSHIGKGEHVKEIVDATTRKGLQVAHTHALNKP